MAPRRRTGPCSYATITALLSLASVLSASPAHAQPDAPPPTPKGCADLPQKLSVSATNIFTSPRGSATGEYKLLLLRDYWKLRTSEGMAGRSSPRISEISIDHCEVRKATATKGKRIIFFLRDWTTSQDGLPSCTYAAKKTGSFTIALVYGRDGSLQKVESPIGNKTLDCYPAAAGFYVKTEGDYIKVEDLTVESE